jgi:hypothetical protein
MLDHGVDGELGPYLVLPLLPGTNLRALCGGRALCPEAALLLALPIARATAALHAAGYVHRDLKPENAIAGPEGSITVIDLGLAWREGMTRHTDTGAAVGSVGYMAPEQVEGGHVDARADVFALGVMIYEWCAGKRPFARGRPAEEAAAALLGTHPRLAAADRRCGEELSELVARCVATDRDGRPSSAELVGALEALVDWTDAADAERAAVIADPVGYQGRVAPFRVRRLERLARDEIAAGKPFAALALCDRGLAYAPEDPELHALVVTAEAETARSGAATTEVAAATAAPSLPAPKVPRRWPWIVAAALGAVVGALVIYAVMPDRRAPAPAPEPIVTTSTTTMDDRDRELVHDFISVFGQAVAQSDHHAPPGGTPTTATGWMELAQTQAPADAVASIRHALALNPTWLDAQIALCAALAASHDSGALSACDVALQRRPDDVAARAARGLARLEANQPAAALVDLDRVVAADPDPKWRRLRARAKSATGDHAGAKRDLDNACKLGDSAACGDGGKVVNHR